MLVLGEILPEYTTTNVATDRLTDVDARTHRHTETHTGTQRLTLRDPDTYRQTDRHTHTHRQTTPGFPDPNDYNKFSQ